jgi:crotonobetainyl-CoA:carnitine CoA-transferase CaiB-like acyl-CoA transferase
MSADEAWPYECFPTDELEAHGPSRGFELLQGVRVLDLTSSIAGPYGSQLLADLGADVVKIERADRGDDARQWGPPFLDGASLWFLAVNRNKRSVTLDFSTTSGQEVLGRLIGASDVLITNLRGATLQRLGIDYASASSVRPGLIHCTVTGFGLTGPDAHRSGYDLIAEGLSGVMDLTGEPDALPQKVGTPAADLLAGMDAAFAIVAALFDRQRTGNGHQLDISLVESMTRFLTPRIMTYLGSGEEPRRSGGRDSVIAVYQVFETIDQPITIALGNDHIFQRFCRAIGRADLASEPRYATNTGRRAHRAELVGTIQQSMMSRTRAEWLTILELADVPAGAINRISEVVRDRHLLDRSMFYQIPVGSGIPQVNTSWHLDGVANGYRSAPPQLGQHTHEVLGEWAEMSMEQIEQAREVLS